MSDQVEITANALLSRLNVYTQSFRQKDIVSVVVNVEDLLEGKDSEFLPSFCRQLRLKGFRIDPDKNEKGRIVQITIDPTSS
jgi:hypothetical protein